MKVLITITCLCILATTGYLATKEYRAIEKEQSEEFGKRVDKAIFDLKRAHDATKQ